ncbi:hypothetical protein A2W67_00130 [Candidatus Nomurabacteria bacterium RIFCSPLOWO2_02_40_28]|nr:MAG: hypothetical protein A2W50_03145 [Candidatus Nomurabacteria bacterium RIFCSPHIGHO2_02_40_30]OGI79911.1 MAG: hypothetical protein A2W43_03050 [Candidatus Nomurabacteria bacterium RIFCSPHIGHO2_12_40_11]OGI82414.1 MAG: hypothetical protein A3E33_02125 [Candidatus Nomurabacteria bacterium RIFCSPHIGHO2_12_FULL_40_77]OGI96043.1 MAG: hypothetical protein A2W67_00130 [Candidatus Nomurabacteria bacterium RIFCSPLOWO2_02_40_28]OGI98303.1 MAG: hypothetical protein A2W78_03770 [Candidatus Nomurabact
MQYIFYLPAVLFVISGLPQMIKLLKTKSSGDISISMFIITIVAISIVIIDAYIQGNTSILVSNLASLSIVSVNTFLIIKYRKK